MRTIVANATPQEVSHASSGPVAWDVAVHGVLAGAPWAAMEVRLLDRRLPTRAAGGVMERVRKRRSASSPSKREPPPGSRPGMPGDLSKKVPESRQGSGSGLADRVGGLARLAAQVDLAWLPPGVDVLYSHLRYLKALPRQLPLVWSTNGVIPEIWNWRSEPEQDRVRKSHSALQRSLALRADKVICWTEYGADHLARTGVPEQRIAVVPPMIGIPPSADATDAPLGRQITSGLVALHVGSWGWLKGLPEALAAVSRVENIELHVVGHPAPDRVPPRTVWHGALSPDRVGALLESADILLMPSRYETFGACYLEAMAAGVAVVGSRIGTVAEIVGDSGILVDPGDIEGLVEVLEWLASDTRALAELKARGRERYERCFRPAVLLPRWEEVFS